MVTKNYELHDLPAWKTFVKEYNLTQLQADQFEQYLSLIRECSELFNLTTITDPESIIAFHFQDSLAISDYIKSPFASSERFNPSREVPLHSAPYGASIEANGKEVSEHAVAMIADVGSGAGFPGIPLKILFPQIKVILIEVSKKKIEFLTTVIQRLGLQECQVYDLDWRTFLRKTAEPISVFVSRASLHTDELIRMFKPSCIYNDRLLVYWASKDWAITPLEKPFFACEELYTIKQKRRRLIFFKRLHL